MKPMTGSVRIEKIWDFYFELFGQRQSRFGLWLLSTDRIALDCYQVTYLGIGKEKSVPAPTAVYLHAHRFWPGHLPAWDQAAYS